ncbi:MAG: MATE family efflux transporter [Pseudomonadota bacterium]|nr:MATE family efflux transporter [Pseudomonadota bacterium]
MSSLSHDLRRVLGLAWPVMISMVSYSLMSAADAIAVGRLGTVPLAAIGLGVTTTFLFLGLPMGLVRGLRVATAQATGAERENIVDAYAWQAVWLGLGMGVLVAFASVLGPTVFHWLGGTPEVQAEALAYFRIKALAAPVVLLGMALTSWFEGRGDTKSPMRVNVVANLSHVVLVSVLVSGAGPIPGLGIRGAAWAGVIVLTGAALALVRMAWPTLRARSARPRRALLRESARLGLPIGVQRLLDITAWSALTGVLASVGDAELAAHTLAIRVLMLSFLPGLAIAEATAVLVGQAVGAKEPDVARRACRAGIVAAVSVMAVGGMGMVLVPELLIAPFHAGADVVPIARKLLWIAAAFQLVDAVATVLYFALDGAGDTRFTLVSSIALSWGVKLPVGVGLATVAGLGAVGAWLGLTGELFVLLGVLLWRWSSGRWYTAPRVLAAAA